MTNGIADGRAAKLKRDTKETTVAVEFNLDGDGRYKIHSGIGMLDHMLEQISRHGIFDITLQAEGDTDRDAHHLVEDIGIVLGRAFSQALGDRRGLVRMGHAIVPLDEALALVAVDISGRGYAAIDASFDREMVGGLPMENLAHFLSAFAREAALSLHVRLLAGTNDHHRAEAIFKALARALMMATRLDPQLAGQVPSTKGTLNG